MEALILIFAEIIFACLAPVFSILGALAAALLEMLLGLLALVFSGGVSGRRRSRANIRLPGLSRRAVHLTAAGLAGLGVVGLLATLVLFQPILRAVLTTAAEKAGMEIRYEAASGSLLFGRVALAGVALTREAETGLAFDLAVDRAEADVDLWSLLGSEPRIELARVAGVTGFVSPPERDTGGARPDRQRRPFRADLARVSNVDIEVRPKDGTAYRLQIGAAQVAPFRSRQALFDLLFRSNLQARVAGQTLSVETRDITEFGRETRWRFENVEADKLKLVVPKAPLTWLEGGRLNVRVEDRWSLSDDWIDMNWQISMAGVRVAAPELSGRRERVLATGLKQLVALQGGNATFGYRLQLDKEDIAAMRAGDLRAFWDVVLSGFLSQDAAAAEVPGTENDTGDADEDAPGRLRRTLDRVKSVLRQSDAE
ncbi:MAG: hypothetical protein QNJ44_08075 [Rhodobacter sp.]|nr:hypothetical protein [Rhodobacter sp.]